MDNNKTQRTSVVSRRDFLKAGAATSATVAFAPGKAFAAGSDTIRIALIGCGSRGTGAAKNCLASSEGLQLIALADLFEDKLAAGLAAIKKDFPDQVKVTPETTFIGFDAYKKVMATKDVDVVLLTTPPGFRPTMVAAAVEAGKHIFMEKPGGVDPVGIRSLMASADKADEKGLSIVVGTQQRWQPQYQMVIEKLRNGELGDIVSGQAYWHWGSSKWHWQPRKPQWSDMEWQIRCWPYFVWLSGDHIVEQHMHNMDIINWAIGSPPIQCLGIGGRQQRTGTEFGNIWDHFAVEYEYENGIRVASYSSQIQGSTSRVGERIVGTKGSFWTDRGKGYITDTRGEKIWSYEGRNWSGLVAEHAGLIKSIRDGKPINECRRLATSTMTMIMGRMSAYTGRALSWKWVMKSSKLDLSPEKLQLGPLPVRPVAVQGEVLPV